MPTRLVVKKRPRGRSWLSLDRMGEAIRDYLDDKPIKDTVLGVYKTCGRPEPKSEPSQIMGGWIRRLQKQIDDGNPKAIQVSHDLDIVEQVNGIAPVKAKKAAKKATA